MHRRGLGVREHTVAHGHGRRRRRHPFEDHDELVSADPADQGVPIHGVTQPGRQFHQEFVAGVVTIGVVDGLEVVDIDVEHRNQRRPGIPVPRQVCQTLVELTAVGQIGQRVVAGQMADLGLRLLDLGEVVDHRCHVQVHRLADGRQGDRDIHPAAVEGRQRHLQRMLPQGGHGDVQLFTQVLAIVLGSQVHDGSADQRVVLAAEQRGGRLVAAADLTGLVDGQDGVTRGLHHGGVLGCHPVERGVEMASAAATDTPGTGRRRSR